MDSLVWLLACGEWFRQVRDSNPRRFILADSYRCALTTRPQSHYHSELMKLSFFNSGHAPPPCIDAPFGCCWDKSTAAAAPIGTGADKCPRKHRISQLIAQAII